MYLVRARARVRLRARARVRARVRARARARVRVREAVAVLDPAEELDLASEAVRLARREHVLDVRVLVVLRAPRAVDDLARAVLVCLGRAQDGEGRARRARERDRLGLADLPPREVGDGEEDGHRHRDALAREAVLVRGRVRVSV